MIVFYHQEKCTNCTDHHLFQSRIHVSKSAFMKQAMLTIFSTSRPAVLFGRTSNGGEGGENEERIQALGGVPSPSSTLRLLLAHGRTKLYLPVISLQNFAEGLSRHESDTLYHWFAWGRKGPKQVSSQFLLRNEIKNIFFDRLCTNRKCVCFLEAEILLQIITL